MKLKSTYLAPAFLLLIASFASATDTASPDAASFLQSLNGIPECAVSASAVVLPALNPAPEEKQTSLPCGRCSESSCLGQYVGSSCVTPEGKVSKCVLVEFCTAGTPGTGRLCDCDGYY